MARRLVWLLVPLLALASAGLLLALDENQGLSEWNALRGRMERAEERVQALENRRDELVSEIHELRSDELAIESVARESLGLVRRDEVVVRLDSEPPSGSP